MFRKERLSFHRGRFSVTYFLDYVKCYKTRCVADFIGVIIQHVPERQFKIIQLRSVLIKLFKSLPDQLIVPKQHGNARGGKRLAVEPLGQGHIHRTKR
ncbi:MAG: hypothetical protein WAV32_09430, partial [Halobacteriota archaeon]